MKTKAIVFFSLFATVTNFVLLQKATRPHEINNYPLVKLDGKGKAMGEWRGPWSCVEDTKTGLTWEVKSYDETLRDEKCSYSWFDGTIGFKHGGSCFTSTTKANTKDIVEYANSIKLCGKDNWRLPTSKELQTLVYKKAFVGKAKIQNPFFPRTSKDVYWSSTIKQKKQQALGVNFLNGSIEWLSFDNVARVRLVSLNPNHAIEN